MKNHPEIIAILTLIIFSISILTQDIEIVKISFTLAAATISGYFAFLQHTKS
jgi:hypothetical protein